MENDDSNEDNKANKCLSRQNDKTRPDPRHSFLFVLTVIRIFICIGNDNGLSNATRHHIDCLLFATVVVVDVVDVDFDGCYGRCKRAHTYSRLAFFLGRHQHTALMNCLRYFIFVIRIDSIRNDQKSIGQIEQ